MRFADPRDSRLGFRIYSPATDSTADTDRTPYDAARIEAVVPEGPTDLEPNKALLLENGFERLGGVDFRKGCFVGQEVTARMKYRNLGKKRLMSVTSAGAALETGARDHGRRAHGWDRAFRAGGSALALMRHEFSTQALNLHDSSAVHITADPDAPEGAS